MAISLFQVVYIEQEQQQQQFQKFKNWILKFAIFHKHVKR